MDQKIKMLVVLVIAVTFLSIGISFLQYASMTSVLASMSLSP
ncbi:MAG TPA: hypothetical protein VKM55_26050 [Candidatus Lokiarchaeia archaeon]|nr:hypothetical protein [Candidatus Lokiarchaeia archaeon]